MATLTLERPQPSEVHCARTLHTIQKGYAIWIGFLLFLYSALFFTLAFFGPHLQPLATLYTGGSLADRQEAATKLLDLSETVWVAVPVVLLGAAILSLVLTKRVVGPLQILEHSIRHWAQGDLTGRVGFRKVDRLDHFAQSINSAVQTIEGSFADMADERARAQTAVDRVLAVLEAQPGVAREVLQGLGEVKNTLIKLDATAQRFRFERR